MGVWKLDGDAVKNLKKPYHAGIVPTNTASEGGTPTSTPRGSTDQTGVTSRGQTDPVRRSSLLPVNLKEQQQEIDSIKQMEATGVAKKKQVEDFLRSMYSSSGR